MIAPEICTCAACLALDRRHPAEGVQLRLLGSEIVDGPASLPARPSHSEASTIPAVDVSDLRRPDRKYARGTKTLATGDTQP